MLHRHVTCLYRLDQRVFSIYIRTGHSLADKRLIVRTIAMRQPLEYTLYPLIHTLHAKRPNCLRHALRLVEALLLHGPNAAVHTAP